MVFELKCVLAVWVHNHPMIKIHPVVFLKSPWTMTAFSDQAVHRFLAEWCHTSRPHPRLLRNTVVLSQTRSEWAVDSRSRGRQEYLEWSGVIRTGARSGFFKSRSVVVFSPSESAPPQLHLEYNSCQQPVIYIINIFSWKHYLNKYYNTCSNAVSLSIMHLNICNLQRWKVTNYIYSRYCNWVAFLCTCTFLRIFFNL